MNWSKKLTLVFVSTVITITTSFPSNSETKISSVNQTESSISSEIAKQVTKAPQKEISQSFQSQNKQLTYPSDSWRLVGTWYAHEVEFDRPVKIYWHARADGTYTAVHESDYRKNTISGTWSYSNGVLYQSDVRNGSISGAITWISDNEIEITIIDNGTPAYSGMKRRYRRI